MIIGLDDYIHEITSTQRALAAEEIRNGRDVYPSPFAAEYLSALRLTPLDRCKVVILGNAPSPEDVSRMTVSSRVNQAEHSALSYTESKYRSKFSELLGGVDVTIRLMKSWAKQGVLLLNRHLTSNVTWGWDTVTDSILNLLDSLGRDIVYVMMGREMENVITRNVQNIKQAIILPHPTRKDFMKQNMFDLIDTGLLNLGYEEGIQWTQ